MRIRGYKISIAEIVCLAFVLYLIALLYNVYDWT